MIIILLTQCLLADISHCRDVELKVLDAESISQCYDRAPKVIDDFGKEYNSLWFNRRWICKNKEPKF